MWDPRDPASLETVIADTAARGYDGIETNPLLFDDADAVRSELDSAGLRLLPRVQTFGRTVDDHLDWLRRGVEAACRFDPPHVVVQGGRDSWDDATADAFFGGALAIESDARIPIAQETHRGRILFSPWSARRVLDRFPELHLASDYSHWVVVAERLLDHEGEILARCAARTLHIDARVGHPEGPQVPDPRLERWGPALEAHEGWWRAIADAARGAGRGVLTVTPEFGPPPYRTEGAPDSSELNDWMAQRVRGW